MRLAAQNVVEYGLIDVRDIVLVVLIGPMLTRATAGAIGSESLGQADLSPGDARRRQTK